MPKQPVAAATNPAAPWPPADSLPVFVPPSVMDPVSNLDFLPVDDAFALEFRSESIEQLARGDTLRRGVSERIEAGRSEDELRRTSPGATVCACRARSTNTPATHAPRMAAHLHTTVDGTLDVHSGNEDTVLLAGHMSDRWDGGATIVAAMTDDTVAGGGIRVTAPLDLWMHGLMGVEERIGTCTADAVLLEMSATHYEREYGPGVHAAGLAAYTGSLYLSNRSTFRPLMRVSSGVRNLIDGGGGGDGGGDAGAGDAPAASPPPAPPAGGAGSRAASETLSVATGAGGTMQAGVMAGKRSEDLTGIHRVDDVEALALGTNVPGTFVNSTELRRSTDTAGQLEALQDSMRGGQAGTHGEVTSNLRVPGLDDTVPKLDDTVPKLDDAVPKLDDAVPKLDDDASKLDDAASKLDDAASVHEASALDIEAVVRPAATVAGTDAPVLHSTVWPPQPPPGVKPGLLGGGDRLPQPAAAAPDPLAVFHRLHEFRNYNLRLDRTAIATDFEQAAGRISARLLRVFENYGGDLDDLVERPAGITTAEQAYLALRDMIIEAERGTRYGRAAEIGEALDVIGRYANEDLQQLSTKFGIADAPFTQAIQPPPVRTTIQSDVISAYRQLRSEATRFTVLGWIRANRDFHEAADFISEAVMRRFMTLGGNPEQVISLPSGISRTEQAYRAIDDIARQAAGSGGAARANQARKALEAIDRVMSRELRRLTFMYGPLDALSTQTTPPTPAAHAMRLAPMQPPSGTYPSTAVPSAVQLVIPDAAHHGAPEVTPGFHESAGGLVHTTDVPGPPPASSLTEPSLSEAADALASDLERVRLDQPATTAEQPATTGSIVTPPPADPSSFWLQPVDPWPAPGTVPVDPGLHHAGETVQPPPVTTTPLDDDFRAERALNANRLPPGFNATVLIDYAGRFPVFQLDQILAAGRLPTRTIDFLMETYRVADAGGGNAEVSVHLSNLRAAIERLLSRKYPGRVDPGWLDDVQKLPSSRGVLAPRRPGASAMVVPPGTDPWRIQPPGMSGQPHPVAFDPWSAPPLTTGHALGAEAVRTPVLSTGALPGWQGAETSGFSRAASDAVKFPYSRRKAIADQFRTDHALLAAETALQIGNAGAALGWTVAQQNDVLDDIRQLNAIARLDSAAAAVDVDTDWSAIEALASILDVPTPLP